MKKLTLIINIFISLQFLSPMEIMAENNELETMARLHVKPAVFEITAKVLDQKHNPASKVNEVTVFLIETPKPPLNPGTYTLYYYLDGNLSGEIKNINLPYEFKQDFRGLFEGSYMVEFMLVDQQDRVARAQVEIKVRH